MRIVVLGLRGFPNIQGGVETHCEQLYTRMAAQGHEVIVLGRKPYMTGPSPSSYKGVRLIALGCPRRKSLEALVHTLVGVFRARLLDPDIVHIHAVGPSLLVPLARILGMKVVSTNHGADYQRQKWGRIARLVLRLGEVAGSRYSNAVVAISQPIATHLRTAYGCNAEIISNGVVTRLPADGCETLEKFGIVQRHYVLAVGRLVPEKGFHDLLEAYRLSGLRGWKVVIAGNADHEDAYSVSLRRKAADTPGIVMTGFVSGEPLAQLYSHAGLFVLPSYHEGLPIALLEAMSFGLSVLASGIPANRETGLAEDRMFAPGDVESLARCLAHFASTPLSPDEKSRQIRTTAARYDWDSIARRTLALYDRVLEPAAVRA